MGETKQAGVLRLGLTLAAFAAAACVALAFVYQGTKGKIAENQQKELQAALGALFSEADQFPPAADMPESPDSAVSFEEAYEARQDGELIGMALRVSRGSYGGPLKVLVGVSAGGTITGVRILEHQDTPGLGANAASPSYFVDRSRGITFTGQFREKPVSDPFEVKTDVEAITASTITSRAVADAVKAAGRAAASYLGDNR
ncbi:MAG: RnfABCDGE type electron transport complex subunit G [Treponema sp.]|jgi:electron transport complex protein RnfG|nr:RnfABCDGE type electron transport complex subunit G [Treponema sp.]